MLDTATGKMMLQVASIATKSERRDYRDDCRQDALVRMLECYSRSTAVSGGQLRNYMLLVAKQEAKKAAVRLRRPLHAPRDMRVPQSTAYDAAVLVHGEASVHAPEHDHDVYRSVMHTYIHSVISSCRYPEAVTAVLLHDMPYAEAAATHGVSVTALKGAVAKVKDCIRKSRTARDLIGLNNKQ